MATTTRNLIFAWYLIYTLLNAVAMRKRLRSLFSCKNANHDNKPFCISMSSHLGRSLTYPTTKLR